jgi:hypothetical protein
MTNKASKLAAGRCTNFAPKCESANNVVVKAPVKALNLQDQRQGAAQQPILGNFHHCLGHKIPLEVCDPTRA